MPKHRIDCYNDSSGVVITFTWEADEEEDYLQSKAFLQKMLGGPSVSPAHEGVESFFFATNEQRDAFYKFLRGTKKAKRRRSE